MDGAEQGGRVATRDVFTDEELDQLQRFPDISREELIRYFTLTPAERRCVRGRPPRRCEPSGCRGSAVQPALVGVRARRCRLGATGRGGSPVGAVSYTHLRAHETD